MPILCYLQQDTLDAAQADAESVVVERLSALVLVGVLQVLPFREHHVNP